MGKIYYFLDNNIKIIGLFAILNLFIEIIMTFLLGGNGLHGVIENDKYYLTSQSVKTEVGVLWYYIAKFQSIVTFISVFFVIIFHIYKHRFINKKL